MSDEYAGQLPEDNIVNIAMSSFGQGISVTQTQMLRAFTAIANDGIMLEPKFISALYDPMIKRFVNHKKKSWEIRSLKKQLA